MQRESRETLPASAVVKIVMVEEIINFHLFDARERVESDLKCSREGRNYQKVNKNPSRVI